MAAPLALLTRFAPAPTGFLHLGHVVNAIYVWGSRARVGSQVLLRIEDHDRQRSRPEFERALLDDLDWLGFVPDVFGTNAFRGGPCESRQSDRQAIYEEVARPLTARGLVYGCVCSRADLVEVRARGLTGDGGRCRHAGLPPGRGIAWRLTIEDAMEEFEDGRHGAIQQYPYREHGDVVIRDRHGNWTYHFAVTVDDYNQGISLVIRGDDLLASTGLQIALGRAIGRDWPPRFVHHPLVMGPSGMKLSKSSGDRGVRDLRSAGATPAEVIGSAAHLVGLVASPIPVPADEVAGLFK